VRSTRAWIWVCVLGTLLVSLACDDDDDDGGGDPLPDGGGQVTTDAGGDAATGLTGNVQGLLTDTEGQGIADVTVSVGGQKATTDKDGMFDVANVPEGDVQVAVEEKKLSAAQTEVTVKGDQKATVVLTADESVVVAIDDVGKGGTIEKDGVTVVLPAMSLHKENGSVASGAGEMHFVVVADPGQAKAAPGGMKGVSGDQPVQLAPAGMIDVRFYQGAERLRFLGEAELTFPLGPNNKSHGEEVAIWSFDEDSGKWKEDGKGMVQRVDPAQPGSVTTKARHFSWWAAAEPLAGATCVSGQLTRGGSPVAGALVELTGRDSLLYVQAASGDDGTFCMATPAGAEVAVTALGGSEQLLAWSWQASAGDAPASCGGACTELPLVEPTVYEPRGDVDAGIDAGVPEDGGVERDAEVPVDAGDDMDATVTRDGGGESDGGTVVVDGSVQLPDASTEPTEICNNGRDDDGDDFVDCSDPDCGPAAPGCVGLRFHGDGAYATIGGITDNGMPNGTIELWFLAESWQVKGGSTLVDLATCGDNYLGITSSGGLVSRFTDCELTGLESEIVFPTQLEAGTWYHLARTWTQNDQRLYLDGTQVGTATHEPAAVLTGGVSLHIGARHDGETGFYFHQGLIDEVRLWGYARSTLELRAARYTTQEGPSGGLLGAWPLNEGSGSFVNDVGSGAHNGILVDGAAWFPVPTLPE
jgi:hypothetical protein